MTRLEKNYASADDLGKPPRCGNETWGLHPLNTVIGIPERRDDLYNHFVYISQCGGTFGYFLGDILFEISQQIYFSQDKRKFLLTSNDSDVLTTTTELARAILTNGHTISWSLILNRCSSWDIIFTVFTKTSWSSLISEAIDHKYCCCFVEMTIWVSTTILRVALSWVSKSREVLKFALSSESRKHRAEGTRSSEWDLLWTICRIYGGSRYLKSHEQLNPWLIAATYFIFHLHESHLF